MSDLKTAIRKALAGSSSQTPVDTRELMSLGTKAEMTVALGEMQNSREINTVQVTKTGISMVQCWLTGAVLLVAYGRNPLAVMPAQIIRDQPKLSPIKEKVMQKTNVKHSSELNAAMMKLITDQPGIKQQRAIEQALKQVPGATEKQAKKLLLNLVHASKKIRAEGPRGDVCYYLNVNGITASKPVASARKAGRRKVQKPAATKPAIVKPAANKQLNSTEQDFSILLAENNDLYINKGGELFILSHDQAARVASFIHRIQAINLLP
jgi:hypothetical protein